MGAILGTALALGASAGTAGINYWANKKAQEKAHERNKKWWKQRFDQQNKYSSPVQQMARMRKAGLNPAMMYGGSQGATTAANPSASEYKAPEMNMDNLGAQSIEFANIRRDTESKRAETLLKNQELIKKGFDTKISESQAQVSERIWESNAQLVEQNVLKMQIQNYVADESKVHQIATAAYTAEAAFEAASLAGTKSEIAKAELEVKKQIEKLAVEGIINSEGGAMQTLLMYLLRNAKDMGLNINPFTWFKD